MGKFWYLKLFMWKLGFFCKFVEFEICICVYKVIVVYILGIFWFLFIVFLVYEEFFIVSEIVVLNDGVYI